MLKSQEIQLRQSEIRQRLNAIAGMEGDAVTDEIRAESVTLRKELDAKENEYRDAIKAEDETETRHRGEQGQDADGKGAEFRALCGRVRLGRYIAEAVTGKPLKSDSAEAEMRAELEMDELHTPWVAFDPGREWAERAWKQQGLEIRQDAATQAPASIQAQQDMILQRVFAPTAAMFLGVAMRSVSFGDSVHPVITAGADAAIVAKGAEHLASEATITSTSLDRRRATARYVFRVEDLGGMGDDLEDALRTDMIGAIGESIDKNVLSGDGVAPNASGFLDPSGGPLTIPADPPGPAAAAFADIVSAAAGAVDGRYAVNLSQVRILMNGESYGVAASAFTTAGEISGADYLMRHGGGIRSSDNMPATASGIATGIAYRSGAMGASSILPLWRGLETYRDTATRIARGEIAVTCISLFNFAVLRAGAYRAFKLRLA